MRLVFWLTGSLSGSRERDTVCWLKECKHDCNLAYNPFTSFPAYWFHVISMWFLLHTMQVVIFTFYPTHLIGSKAQTFSSKQYNSLLYCIVIHILSCFMSTHVYALRVTTSLPGCCPGCTTPQWIPFSFRKLNIDIVTHKVGFWVHSLSTQPTVQSFCVKVHLKWKMSLLSF